MRTGLLATTVVAFLSSTSCTGGSSPIGVGSAGRATIELPGQFYWSHESKNTILIMPRKDDMDGPISMRLTCLRDLSDLEPDDSQVADLLYKVNPGSKLESAGGNQYTSQKSEETAPDGTNLFLRHYAVHADGLLITATIQTVKGRESEPQCEELLNEFTDIIASLSRG